MNTAFWKSTLRFVRFGCFGLSVLGTIKTSASVTVNTEYVNKPVVFLYAADAAGNVAPDKPLGTGFIVQAPKVSDPKSSYKLLVTARHIVDPQWAHCPDQNPARIFMRINKKSFDAKTDSVGTVDVPLTLIENGRPTWVSSSDSEVDAAIIPVAGLINQDAQDISAVNVADFPTADELKKFATGDEVISAGLLPGASGKKRNYPVFKFGNISSIPDEPIDSVCIPPGLRQAYPRGTPAYSEKLWLVAASLAPGNSGSPIFFMPAGSGGLRMDPRRPVLLGVQSTSFIPWDLAGMTPVQYVYDMIEKMKLPDIDLHRNAPPVQPETGN
jgi:hypothetical protein